MRIAIDARVIGSSTGTYALNLIKELEKIDKKNKYFILLRKKDFELYQPKCKNFQRVIADIKDYSFEEQIKLKKLLDGIKPDLVHFCMPQQPLLYKGKKITTIHDLTLLKSYNPSKNKIIFYLKQLVAKYLFKKIARSSDFIITPSNFTREEYLNFSKVEPDKVKVIYESGIDNRQDLVYKEYKIPFKKYILYVGQQTEYKNLKRLGKAHQLLLDKYPNLGLVLVGRLNVDAELNKSYFSKNGFKNIIFTGYISNSERNWLYKNAECYVFPSLMEGFGLPGLEAMAYETPVISSNATCLPEIYRNAAIYFDPLSYKDIADKIDIVLSGDRIKQELIINAKQVLPLYSWSKMAKETYKLYYDILKN
ncbi:glycosyltransferase family 4 protein [Volucribacter amazonae]|uniref:Glycosyl transferase family 1 n=1 Tax=Volucribacter amazonae TaxID=256731 RepID=A0A9X4PB17_9PAST|nr:glycosyltransferase family 1 protein [Volucribacter amazonae]MDG6894872.1 glycosyl transferase family 1 [Volucribacter amazonae]